MVRHTAAILLKRAMPALALLVAGCPSEHADAMETVEMLASDAMTGGGGGMGAVDAGGMGGSGGTATAPLPPNANALPDDLSTYREDLPAEGSGFEPMRCTNGRFDPMPFVVPSEEVDFRAVRDPILDTPGLMSEWGTLCANASDEAACRAAYDAVPEIDTSACYAPRCSNHFISTTLGDDVKHRTSMDDKRAFLGAIDTPEEAQLLVVLHGYTLGHGDGCDTATVRETDDGYEIYARVAKHLSPCGLVPNLERVLLAVARDGVVTELRRVHNDALIGVCF